MSDGYMGVVLFVDLTSGTIKEEKLEEKTCRGFIGGPGLGARILYERMRAKMDPLGPHNLIGFVTGPLTGTAVPCSPRCTVVTKSPLTETWNDSNVGGHFAPELKATGYDAVFFSGISPKPVYFLLHNGRVELRDATQLWGKETFDTEESLCRELGDKAIRVASIGPVGESQSLLAAVMTEGRAAGRSGIGAVMGSKRLKAIVARGTRKVPIADVERLRELRRLCLSNLRETKAGLIKPGNVGTANTLATLIVRGICPIKNWSLIGAEAWPSYSKLGWTDEEIAKYQVRKFACAGCPIACGGIVTIKEGPFAVTEVARVEYESAAGFGAMCLIDNVEAVIKAQDVCNRYGMDTISASSAIAFAMECYERGLISKKDTEGIELNWGDDSAMIVMLDKMVRRQGFGAVLADGVRRAAERIGKGADEFAMHIHGQEPGYHDPRLILSRGLNYIVDPAPGRHTTSTVAAIADDGGSFGPYPELKFTKFEADDYQNKALMNATACSYHQVYVSCGLCTFELMSGNFPLIELVSAVTGWDFCVAEAVNTGRRIQAMRQMFNIREGLQPSDFQLPERMAKPPSMGPFAGRKVDFNALRAAYYKAMGWDVNTGRPLDKTLKELGLGDLVSSFGGEK